MAAQPTIRDLDGEGHFLEEAQRASGRRHGSFAAAGSVLLACLALAACGFDREQATGPDAPPPEPPASMSSEPLQNARGADIADAYALELSGGQRKGCASAAPGPEAAGEPGCIYAAAFAGCQEGLESARGRGGDPAQQFPEPELLAVYERAFEECAGRR